METITLNVYNFGTRCMRTTKTVLKNTCLNMFLLELAYHFHFCRQADCFVRMLHICVSLMAAGYLQLLGI